MTPVAKSSGGRGPTRLFPQLKPRPHHRESDNVAGNQRARLYAAMIQAVAAHGYAGTSTRELAAMAGVGRKTLYDEFGGKEAYFLATYDVIALRAIQRVKAAYLSERDWTRQLHAAFAAFAAEVVDQPKAARLALVEALGAGPAALAQMERVSAQFEGLIRSSFGRVPDGVSIPPLIVRGIVGGISRVARQLLIEHREGELPSLADTLVEWALTYRSPAATLLKAPPSPRGRARDAVGRLQIPTDDDDHARILSAAARLAAEKGFPTLSVAQIVQAAGVSDRVFFELYETKEDCFLASYDRMGAEVVRYAAEAARVRADRLDSVHHGINALMYRVAFDRVFARCAFMEVFALGPKGIDRRSRLMDSFAALLMSQAPAGERPAEVVADAIVGAVWQIAHCYIARDATHRLAELADHASYLVLAPMIGGEAAMERILERQTDGD